MANYYCDYVGDNGILYRNIGFSVFITTVTVGTRGVRSNTSYSFDDENLPTVLANYLIPTQPKAKYCELQFTYRNALLWLDRTRYINCPVPWEPNSGEFNSFFTEVRNGTPSKYLQVGIDGEFIESSWLEWFVKNG